MYARSTINNFQCNCNWINSSLYAKKGKWFELTSFQWTIPWHVEVTGVGEVSEADSGGSKWFRFHAKSRQPLVKELGVGIREPKVAPISGFLARSDNAFEGNFPSLFHCKSKISRKITQKKLLWKNSSFFFLQNEYCKQQFLDKWNLCTIFQNDNIFRKTT